MPTGREVRARIIDKRRLGWRSRTTGAGTLDALVDTERLRQNTIDPSQFNGAFLRVLDDTNNKGYVGAVDHIDPLLGAVYVSPSVGTAFATGSPYEIWYRHHPDDVDKARDRALTTRCSVWRWRALSILPPVEAWPAGAYAAGAGGVSAADAGPESLAFPHEYFDRALRVENSGAGGFAASVAADVQGRQRLRLFGFVSAQVGTARAVVRDLDNDIVVRFMGTDSSVFQLRGWQRFDLPLEVPADCGRVEVRLAGDEADADVLWAGVGLAWTEADAFTLSDVKARTDVGLVRTLYSERTVDGANRWRTEDQPREVQEGRVLFGTPPARSGAVYYESRTFYAALQAAYDTRAQRAAADDAATDCALEYVEPATVVELLSGNVEAGSDLARTLAEAEKDLAAWEQRGGPRQRVAERPRKPRPYMLGLR